MTRARRSTWYTALPLAFTAVTLAACAPVRTYGRSVVIAQKCIAADELRRGRGPAGAPGTPVPVTPADSTLRPSSTAAAIRCEGGLTR